MPAVREVDGVKFLVYSPAIWDVVWPPVSIIFVGDGWMICHNDKPMHLKPFATQRAAIDIINRSVRT